MAQVTRECTECGNEYTVKAANVEVVQFCPFCGADEGMTPYDDLDNDVFDIADEETNDEIDDDYE